MSPTDHSTEQCIARLNHCVNELLSRPKQSTLRLRALADFCTEELAFYGLPNVMGGSTGELRLEGLARSKNWDVAYQFAGKFRLLISLKSMLQNISGSVPNRLDDLMGEAANVQQLAPEIVIGYIVIFDLDQDSRRQDGQYWSDYFENGINRIAIRQAPLWNQGLLEGTWFIRIGSSRPPGERVLQPETTVARGEAFFRSLLRNLAQREPAIPFSKPIGDL